MVLQLLCVEECVYRWDILENSINVLRDAWARFQRQNRVPPPAVAAGIFVLALREMRGRFVFMRASTAARLTTASGRETQDTATLANVSGQVNQDTATLANVSGQVSQDTARLANASGQVSERDEMCYLQHWQQDGPPSPSATADSPWSRGYKRSLTAHVVVLKPIFLFILMGEVPQV